MPDSVRSRVVGQLVDVIVAIERPYPVRVAVHNRSGAGTSTLSDELVARLRQRRRTAIQALTDNFFGLWLDKRNHRFLIELQLLDAGFAIAPDRYVRAPASPRLARAPYARR